MTLLAEALKSYIDSEDFIREFDVKLEALNRKHQEAIYLNNSNGIYSIQEAENIYKLFQDVENLYKERDNHLNNIQAKELTISKYLGALNGNKITCKHNKTYIFYLEDGKVMHNQKWYS